MLLTMLLASAQPAAETAPASSPRMVELVAKDDGAHCLPDGQICFALPNDGESDALPTNLAVSFPGSGDDEKTVLPLPAIAGEPQALRLWPNAVWVRGGEEADGGEGLEMLVGVIGVLVAPVVVDAVWPVLLRHAPAGRPFRARKPHPGAQVERIAAIGLRVDAADDGRDVLSIERMGGHEHLVAAEHHLDALVEIGQPGCLERSRAEQVLRRTGAAG